MHFPLYNGICGLVMGLWTVSAANVQPARPALAGVVVDAASGQPVPFAVVELKRLALGVQATEQGAFLLELPATLSAADSLQVSSLGFEKAAVAVPAASPMRVALRRLAVALPETVVRPPAPPVRLGPTAHGTKFGFSGGSRLTAERAQGWQVARKFTDAPAGTVQAVRFYVKPGVHCGKTSLQAPFRVRLYAANGPAGAPGTDLLLTSVVTHALAAGWHEVDLSSYCVPVPPEGFYVAMEWLYTNAGFGCNYTYTSANKERKSGYNYGQTLGGYLGPTSAPGWYLSAGYPWQEFHQPAQLAAHGDPSAAIQALVQPD
ncbi:hypothetical protein ACFST9_25480 [Hymenobacter monticola]|uniref:Carboxypeptidase-like regulatory domain-containing protein n=1 Tax=Hymenobacter monticola TaxID=1705399 RepID=A0ABY4B727_9BACT|nr:hypothetical protein [Hymenobacter monticola]UOE34674.1 hypothetical protein MTP16_03255 [Hymenobacter monticola]